MTCETLLITCAGHPFQPLILHGPASLQSEINVARISGDTTRQLKLYTLLATVNGHYDFRSPSLNRAFRDTEPMAFATWLAAKWNLAQ